MAQARYLVDEQNRKKAVVLSVKDYTQLVARIEELEDALDLDEAIRMGRHFRDYEKIRKDLIEQGRL